MTAGRALTDEELAEVASAKREHCSNKAAAAALGIEYDAFKKRLKRAAERGYMGFAPVLPGFRVSQITTGPRGESIQQRPEHGDVFEVPTGQVIDKVSALTDPDGRIVLQWTKTKSGKDAVDWVETFKSAFADFDGRADPVEPPRFVEADFANLICANDWHLNMLAWRRETGRSWDLKIAETAIGDAIETAIARARRASVAIVLGGGDLLHNDNNSNTTAKSNNVLDCDGRHQKGIEVAQRLMIRTIDAALKHNGRVVVRNLKGNHDEVSSAAVGQFLSAWYRNEPRITVDLDASWFWYYQFGKVMLAATHGSEAKLADMPSIMAHRRAQMWGETEFRYAHGFHVHHRSKLQEKEAGGVICESHQAPIPPDGWHYGKGYLSGQSVQVITYHREYGEWTREREPVLDAAPAQDMRMAA